MNMLILALVTSCVGLVVGWQIFSRIGNGKQLWWNKIREGVYEIEYLSPVYSCTVGSDRCLLLRPGMPALKYYGWQSIWVTIPYGLILEAKVGDFIFVRDGTIKMQHTQSFQSA